jgi:hypothetical protein
VEEDEEVEREDERGVAKRPDLNELDVPELAELALDKVEWRELLQRIALYVEMETASRRQSATTRVCGSIGSAEIFAEGTAYTTTKWDVHHAGLTRYRQGTAGGRWSLEAGGPHGTRLFLRRRIICKDFFLQWKRYPFPET